MGYERKIVQRLFESRGLAEASFQSGGSTYKCAFGKYYKDGEEINRDEYFKAKENEGSGSAPAQKSMSDVLTGFEKRGDYGYSSKNATQDDVDRVSDYLKSTGFEQTDSDNSAGDWRKFTDKEGNEVEVTFDNGYMEVNGFLKSDRKPANPDNATPASKESTDHSFNMQRDESGNLSTSLGSGKLSVVQSSSGYKARVSGKNGNDVYIGSRNFRSEEEAQKFAEEVHKDITQPPKDFSSLKDPQFKKSIATYKKLKGDLSKIPDREMEAYQYSDSQQYWNLSGRAHMLEKGLSLASEKSEEDIHRGMQDAANRIASSDDFREAQNIYKEEIIPYMYASGKVATGIGGSIGETTFRVKDETYGWNNIVKDNPALNKKKPIFYK